MDERFPAAEAISLFCEKVDHHLIYLTLCVDCSAHSSQSAYLYGIPSEYLHSNRSGIDAFPMKTVNVGACFLCIVQDVLALIE
jgi:hypothetical protein